MKFHAISYFRLVNTLTQINISANCKFVPIYRCLRYIQIYLQIYIFISICIKVPRFSVSLKKHQFDYISGTGRGGTDILPFCCSRKPHYHFLLAFLGRHVLHHHYHSLAYITIHSFLSPIPFHEFWLFCAQSSTLLGVKTTKYCSEHPNVG